MAKEKNKFELRPVDDEAETPESLVQQHEEEVQKIEKLRPVKTGIVPSGKRAETIHQDDSETHPDDPNVERVEATELSVTEDTWGETPLSKTTFPWKWVATVGCLIVAALSFYAFHAKRGAEERRLLMEQALAAHEKKKADEQAAISVVKSLKETAKEFLEASSIEEMLMHVRHPDRVKKLMERHYAGNFPKPVPVVRILEMSPLTIENTSRFWMLLCELESGANIIFILEAISDTEAKVDWETHVCYQPMAWDDFARSRPAGYTGDFRVQVKKDYIYSDEFSNTAAFECYQLKALGSNEELFGYVPVGSSIAQQISEEVKMSNGEPTALMLRLHIPDGVTSRRGVVIRELVNPRWLFLESPEKEEP